MNYSLLQTEIILLLLGIVALLADLWLPATSRKSIGYATAACLFALFLYGFRGLIVEPVHATAFPIGASKSGMFIQDGLAAYFKQ